MSNSSLSQTPARTAVEDSVSFLSDRRADERKPIRLKVTYKSAKSLVTRYTTSVSKGGCLLTVSRPLALGTAFVFEMYADGDDLPVEVEGKVVRVIELIDGQYEIAVKYTADNEKRHSLDRVLDRVMSEPHQNNVRSHPRVPVNLVALDESGGVAYVIRDLSLGGMGLRLGSDHEPPPEIKVGAAVRLIIETRNDVPCDLNGEVMWMSSRGPSRTHAAVGVRFTDVRSRDERLLARMIRLHRPERIRIRFG